MSLRVEIQSASAEPVPAEDDIRDWIAAVLDRVPAPATPADHTEISVRLVDIEEMTRLNETFRGGAGPTNVLSFPADLPADLGQALLGDIVICAPVVREEAAAQGKSLRAHWAHMTVHGTLHLFGYDHVKDSEATAMESLETDILGGLSFPCPYEDDQTEHSAT